MNAGRIVLGSSPAGSFGEKIKLAGFRALRTLLQGLAAAVPASGAGAEILDTKYWETLGYSALAAVLAAVASFFQNAATFLPDDPTQKPVDGTPQPPAPAPAPPANN